MAVRADDLAFLDLLKQLLLEALCDHRSDVSELFSANVIEMHLPGFELSLAVRTGLVLEPPYELLETLLSLADVCSVLCLGSWIGLSPPHVVSVNALLAGPVPLHLLRRRTKAELFDFLAFFTGEAHLRLEFSRLS